MKKFKTLRVNRSVSITSLSKKYKVSESEVDKALRKGITYEHKKIKRLSTARKVALANLAKDLKYYDKKKVT